MHRTVTNLAPSNAFFEFTQINNQIEVKSILPCNLLQQAIEGTQDQIDLIPNDFSSGPIFQYLQDNLVLMDNSGNKLALSLVEKSGRDLDTKMMSLNLIFLPNGVKPKWMINTLFFDTSSIHLNFHKFNLEDEDYLITSKSKYRLPVKFKKRNNSWWIILLVITLITALALYLLI
jgi:hypothetical protein